jgi:hypothetical protein
MFLCGFCIKLLKLFILTTSIGLGWVILTHPTFAEQRQRTAGECFPDSYAEDKAKWW